MYKTKLSSIFLSILISLAFVSQTVLSAMPEKPEERASLPYTFSHQIASEAIGETYQLWVSVPLKYAENPDANYPVVYVLDADFNFGTVRDTFISYRWGRYVPEAIIVGIAYGREIKAWEDGRCRDFTPILIEPHEGSGSAPAFLKFIQTSVVPFIDQTYRTNLNDRTLIGMSLGGLFTTYVLFEEPDLFNRFLISSPWLLGDGGSVFRLEEKYAETHEDLPKRIFVSAGSLEHEKFHQSMNKLKERLDKHAYPSLVLETRVFEGETHPSVFPFALTQGIRFLFADTVEQKP